MDVWATRLGCLSDMPWTFVWHIIYVTRFSMHIHCSPKKLNPTLLYLNNSVKKEPIFTVQDYAITVYAMAQHCHPILWLFSTHCPQYSWFRNTTSDHVTWNSRWALHRTATPAITAHVNASFCCHHTLPGSAILVLCLQTVCCPNILPVLLICLSLKRLHCFKQYANFTGNDHSFYITGLMDFNWLI